MNQSIDYEIQNAMITAIDTTFFISRITIQLPDGSVSGSGIPSNTYVDVAGLVDIMCMDAVPSPTTILATETRVPSDISTRGVRHIMLDGYYPDAIPAWQQGARAVVDGVTVYDITGVQHDSQHTQTRLHLQLVNV